MTIDKDSHDVLNLRSFVAELIKVRTFSDYEQGNIFIHQCTAELMDKGKEVWTKRNESETQDLTLMCEYFRGFAEGLVKIVFAINDQLYYKKKVLSHESKPSSLFFSTYYLAWLFLCYFYRVFDYELIMLTEKETQGIPISTYINHREVVDNLNVIISDSDFYDHMTAIDIADALELIEYLDADFEVKKELKQALYDKNKNDFLYILLKIKSDYSDIKKAALTRALLNIRVSYFWKSKEYSFTDDAAMLLPYQQGIDRMIRLIRGLTEDVELPVDDKDILNGYNSVKNLIKFYIARHNFIKYFSKHQEESYQLEVLIGNTPRYEEYKNVKLGESILNVYDDYGIDEIMSVFWNLYINSFSLPDPKNEIKDKNDCFDTNLTAEQCCQIYDVLSKAGLLEHDEQVFYSFVYRFSKDYMSDQNPTTMKWLGEDRDLYRLVYVLANATKLWKKTAEFFVNRSNLPVKTNGVLHQAKNASIKMKEIEKELKDVISSSIP